MNSGREITTQRVLIPKLILHGEFFTPENQAIKWKLEVFLWNWIPAVILGI
jgi:hypothetical protein